MFIESSVLPELLWQENPPIAIKLEVGRMAYQQMFDARRHRVKTRQTFDFALDLLPFSERIQK
jgi:hypothetical protein